jgi:hypothetical protein
MSHYHCNRCYRYHFEGEKCPQATQDNASEIAGLVLEMLEIFNRTETTDDGREFSPTTVSSCRAMDAERLREIFVRMDRLTRR